MTALGDGGDARSPANVLYSAAVTAQEAAREWQDTSPSPELRPYYDVWTYSPTIQAVFFAHFVHDRVARSEPAEARAEAEQALVPSVFSRDYFDRRTATFRVHAFDDPNLLAIDPALRILASCEAWPLPSAVYREEQVDRKKVIDRCLRFIAGQKADGQFRVRPSEPSSPFGTLTALLAVRASRDFAEEDVTDLFKSVPNCFVSEEVPFKRQGTNSGCLSTSEQVYRICDLLEQLHVEHQDLEAWLARNAGTMLSFVRACLSEGEEKAGFKWSDKAQAPNLYHTKVGLSLALRLMQLGARTGRECRIDLRWLNLRKIVAFTNDCWSRGGFAVKPEGQPNLRSWYDARGISSLISALRPHVGGSEDEGETLLKRRLQGATQFVRSCLDRDNDRLDVYMYPLDVIHGWRYADFCKLAGSWRDIGAEAMVAAVQANRDASARRARSGNAE